MKMSIPKQNPSGEVLLSPYPSVHMRRSRFVKAYIENGGNATQAAVDAGYPTQKRGGKTKTRQIARLTGGELLSIPTIRGEIVKAFEQRGLSLENVLDIHSRNINQSTSIATSQAAVRDFYKITGIAQQHAPKVRVQFTIKE